MSASNISERYEVIVLGCGKGGKTLATELGNKGVKTAKTFITSARVAQAVGRAGDFGIRTGDVAMDWAAVRRRAEGVVVAMRAMNHKTFTSAPALDFILNSGRFVEPHVIEVRENNGDVRRLSAEKIFINTGTRPAQPSISGLDEVIALNSESIQRLNELPDHLIVLGGSYVALEFAQMFRHFGSKVTVLERAAQLLKREDADVVEVLGGVMREEGIEFWPRTAKQLGCRARIFSLPWGGRPILRN